MLGNEALGMGLRDAGIKFASSYPGTPSTEIMDKLQKYSESGELNAGWSINEAVAFEEAIASSIIGIDSAIICKSVGINVAMDPLMTIANSGTNAAMIIVIADDPDMLSSQNEQDNRMLAFLSNLPIFEPSNVQEAYDIAKDAVLLSRKFKIPVVIRMVTRISHAFGMVSTQQSSPLPKLEFKSEVSRFVNIPANARKNHKRILQVHYEIKEYANIQKHWYETQIGNESDYLVVTSGSTANYVIDALEDLKFNAHLFIPKLINPFPQRRLLDLARKYHTILIIEELEPYLETRVRNALHVAKNNVTVLGKHELNIPRHGELTVEKLSKALSSRLGLNWVEPKELEPESKNLIISRPPILCAGCPHRSTYVLLNDVLKRYDPIYCNDIGCYSLGVLPPHNTADILICMGASIPMATSISLNDSSKLGVAIIGDSTFWHSGLSGLANAIWKKADILVVIMDNFTTAMTGNQENPSSKKKLDIFTTVKAMGAEILKVNPMDYKASKLALRQLMKENGVKVLLSQYPCALNSNRNTSSAIDNPTRAMIKSELCNGCGYCVDKIGCPAFSFCNDQRIPIIDNSLCNGCMYCNQHCHYGAIKKVVLR